MTGLKPRPYQKQAISEIRAWYKKGVKKVLLCMPTGSGKTFCFSIVLNGVKQSGKHAIMVVKGVALVENASQRLIREGVDHGVLMASHWMNRPNEKIQVCSIDTLARRKVAPKADIVVIDEAHMATSPSYKWLAEQYPNAFFLAVTATPHVKQGLKHIADEVVKPITVKELIAQGFLTKPRYFCPTKISTAGVKLDSTGDYNNKELYEAADHAGIYGDLVQNYRKFLHNQPALVFAVNIAHSLKIKSAFEAAGIICEHIDADIPQSAREECIKRLENGETKVITSVGTMTTGVDIPCLIGVILARPTKSYNLHIQMIGRGTRIFPGKKEFKVLDHAGNLERHGIIELERECVLEGWAGSKKDEDTGPSVTTCEKCFAAFSSQERFEEMYNDDTRDYYNLIQDGLGDRIIKTKRLYFCPGCDANCTPDAIERITDEVEDNLKELTPEQIIDLEIKAKIKQFKIIRKAKGYKQGWVYHQLKGEYGEDVAGKYIKKRKVPDWVKMK